MALKETELDLVSLFISGILTFTRVVRLLTEITIFQRPDDQLPRAIGSLPGKGLTPGSILTTGETRHPWNPPLDMGAILDTSLDTVAILDTSLHTKASLDTWVILDMRASLGTVPGLEMSLDASLVLAVDRGIWRNLYQEVIPDGQRTKGPDPPTSLQMISLRTLLQQPQCISQQLSFSQSQSFPSSLEHSKYIYKLYIFNIFCTI